MLKVFFEIAILLFIILYIFKKLSLTFLKVKSIFLYESLRTE